MSTAQSEDCGGYLLSIYCVHDCAGPVRKCHLSFLLSLLLLLPPSSSPLPPPPFSSFPSSLSLPFFPLLFCPFSLFTIIY